MAAVTNVSTPGWLAQHDGKLEVGRDGLSCCVYFAGQLQYVLVPVPAKGRYACRISETVNGRRRESEKTYGTIEEAYQGGLEDLRGYLGW